MTDRSAALGGYTEPDHYQLEQIAEDIGEDPGRWLDGPLDPFPRIRGLRSIEAVRAWAAGERKIAREQNREPDQDVLDALDEREAYLESIDEDPGRREIGRDREVQWFLNGEPWEETDRSSALESLRSERADPESADEEVAGGA